MTEPTPEPTYTLPAQVLEVAFYVYKKLDPTQPASWPNSGVQDLIVAVNGDDWFAEFPGELPAYVCGLGWGVQQDMAAHDGSFVWPESIEFPDDNIGWPPLYAAKHSELDEFVTVPDCVVPVETAAPPVEVPRELAETGAGDELLLWLVVAASALILGGLVVSAFRWMRGDS